ncbi:nucleotidyltransferase family protein [Nostoc sp. FACHB-152]|uniref:nucleotidyltransferase family protein n=1 Tax=unclassified Nostoc TaxID=2593658 RepID=UPI0016867D4B|nr:MULTISPECIES: nucleotidyltransferase family protein [unclassified Nostoc]MBD2449960.1 nucleotidyltransferase family protein [Nostoc sp. FACHB-152]MBD2468448.1 nucleotidyltransferase family protein [Nostoc sp. FACHB-145]
MSDIGIIILAAGASTRLGQPKQLLTYQGKALIRHIADIAIQSQCQPIVLVLGAYAETIKSHLTNLDIHIIYNQHWSDGMASSIKCGLNAIQAISPNIEAVVLMLSDQPFVSPNLIKELVAEYQTTNSLIVASKYADIVGVPALFHKTLFSELALLQGDMGARKTIRQYYSNCVSIPFAEGVIDIDTLEDYEQLQEHRGNIY